MFSIMNDMSSDDNLSNEDVTHSISPMRHFTFTHMMTRTLLLGVMAIVQFSAKYLQCNVVGFFLLGVFYFLLFICIIVIIL